MSCPDPMTATRANKRTARQPSQDAALPDSFTLHFRRRRGKRGGWLINGRSVSASGPEARSAFEDALAGLAAPRNRGGR